MAALVGALLWQRLRARRSVLAVLLLAAAVPGAIGVLVWRGDAPARRDELAEEVQEAVEEIETRAPWPGPVAVVRETDDVRFPLGRYALPTRSTPATPSVELELVGGKLATDCAPDPATQHIVCGDGK